MDTIAKLTAGNLRYREAVDRVRLLETAENGQHPCAIVVCCSDSRVIPEEIFSAGLGIFSSSAWRVMCWTGTSWGASNTQPPTSAAL